jgi:Gas vesicle synthesis protein GvpL/GvpF
MPCLLYCVTQPNLAVTVVTGICESAVQSQDCAGLRAYWSEIKDPESCWGNAEALKKATLQFHQVLREILAAATPLPFPFPTLLESADAIEPRLAAEADLYRAALGRLSDTVQYEIVASWTADEQADLATPVSGREYLKRRQEAAGRIAAIDTKLKSVAGGEVREWRARQERRMYRWFALVPREGRERFLRSLRSAGPSEGVRLRLSGPWPPSEFVPPRSQDG